MNKIAKNIIVNSVNVFGSFNPSQGEIFTKLFELLPKIALIKGIIVPILTNSAIDAKRETKRTKIIK